MFLTIVLSIWTLMHLYVFWRVRSLPWVRQRGLTWPLVGVMAFLWSCYLLARLFEHYVGGFLPQAFEFLGAMWFGIVFLLLVSLMAADVVTGFGFLMRAWVPTIRIGALALGCVLAAIAMIQGFQPPVISHHEYSLRGLPREHSDLRMVFISDLHLGAILGERWLAALVDRVLDLHPDVIIVGGDVIDGADVRINGLLSQLGRLRAPLGVYAVTGNHEFYQGRVRSVMFFEEAGFQVLHDRWLEIVPGLVLAGVDDLTARQQYGIKNDALGTALANRPPGTATLLISHSPLKCDEAAGLGVDLMISGHTHAGQIWPFSFVVGTRYPYVSGSFRIGTMDLLVCRGTGTWGPRMRLWRRSEMMLITLRSSQSEEKHDGDAAVRP